MFFFHVSISHVTILRESAEAGAVLFVIPRRSRRGIVLASSVRPSVRPFWPSTLFVHPEPYLRTYRSDLMHSWYEKLVLSTPNL